MIYTEMTVRAMKLAYDAHHGQVDKGGLPYIHHPLHLAEQMDDEISTCAALLHDVVEDTDVTMADLEKQFPEAVTRAVRLLTREADVSYEDYIRAIRQDPVAVKVKLADLDHNSDHTRSAAVGMSEERKQHYDRKYAQARRWLLEE